jgi:hypothetical protein
MDAEGSEGSASPKFRLGSVVSSVKEPIVTGDIMAAAAGAMEPAALLVKWMGLKKMGKLESAWNSGLGLRKAAVHWRQKICDFDALTWSTADSRLPR